jgi:hypothetical protein
MMYGENENKRAVDKSQPVINERKETVGVEYGSEERSS